MNKKKTISLLLLISLLSSLTACGETTTETTADTAETTAVPETESVETDIIAARKAVSDNLPVMDFSGEEYHIISDENNTGYVLAEELTGDVVSDAVYNRMIDITERFNVTLAESVGGGYGATSTFVKNAVQSGDTTYDIATYHYVQMGIDTLNYLFRDFNTVPYIDFEKPWWNSSTKDILTYKDVTFLAFGDMTISNVNLSGCVYYNKDMAEEYSLEDIYGLVTEGRWTKDKMMEMCSTVYRDTNGDGVKDAGDRYGQAVSLNGFADGYLWSFGKMILEPQEDGSFRDVWYDEKVVDIAAFLYDMISNQQSVYAVSEWDIDYYMFAEGKTLMAVSSLRGVSWGLREVEWDYAIVPVPKWDENQERYQTYVGGSAMAEAVLQTASHLEMVGIVTEALNAEGWKSLMPAFYDISMKYKGTRDEQSIEMLDILMDGRIYDFGYVYGGWDSAGGGAGFWLMKIIRDNGGDVASFYASKQDAWETYMESIYEAFDTYLENNP